MSLPEIPEDFFDASSYYTGPKLTDAMIPAVEKLLGYKLPAAYIQLLRVKNGGAPKRQCYPTGGTHWTDNHIRVTAISGIGGRWGIDSEQLGSRHMIEQGGFPNIGIWVGWTPTAGHDGIFLDYRQCGADGEPCVTLFDAESSEEQALAPNFGAFLHGLVDCRPYDEETARGMEEFRRQSGKG
jgi:SMI1 / KNR4 family (SUKH-1)